MRRPLLALLASAALVPAVPASAAPTVVATGYAVRSGARSATGFCVATGAEVVAVVITTCGFAGEDSGATAVSAGLVAVATFTGPIGEQPKSLCWEGYAVAAVTGALVPFQGCTVVG